MLSKHVRQRRKENRIRRRIRAWQYQGIVLSDRQLKHLRSMSTSDEALKKQITAWISYLQDAYLVFTSITRDVKADTVTRYLESQRHYRGLNVS